MKTKKVNKMSEKDFKTRINNIDYEKVAKGFSNALVKSAFQISIYLLESHYAVAEMRKQKNLSQTDIAEKMEISQNSYSRLERGETKMDYDRLLQIAKILDTDYETIMNLSASIITSRDGNKSLSKYIITGSNNNNEEFKTLKNRIIELESINKDKSIIIDFLNDKIKDLENTIEKQNIFIKNIHK